MTIVSRGRRAACRRPAARCWGSCIRPSVGAGRLADLGVVVGAVVGALDLGDLGRPVNARAALTPVMTASVPELTKRMLEVPGKREHDVLGEEDLDFGRHRERRAARELLESPPRRWGMRVAVDQRAMLLAKSMRSTPSRSVMRQPSPWRRRGGGGRAGRCCGSRRRAAPALLVRTVQRCDSSLWLHLRLGLKALHQSLRKKLGAPVRSATVLEGRRPGRARRVGTPPG
jgi:hypothetical protein